MKTDLLQSLEAEQAVIGGVLLDNSAFARVGTLPAEAFYHGSHRLIWTAVCGMMAARLPVDVVTVHERLEAQNAADGEIFNYIISLAQSTPSAANINRYADIVRERYAARLLADAGQKIGALATEAEGRGVAERQADAMRLLTAAVEPLGGSKTGSYFDALREGVLRMDEVGRLPEGAVLGFTTGLRALDKTTQGLRRGDLTVIGGRPSMGKSVLAENIARHIAKRGYAVRFQSYEMGGADLAVRGMAAEQGLDYGVLRSGRLTEAEWEAVNRHLKTAENWRLDINSAPLNAEQVAAECRLMKQQGGLDLLVIDHLHIMPRPKKNTVQELDDITSAFKNLAMELDIHIIIVAQLSRHLEQRDNKRPMMSDLRESGGIEQNANVIIFPYRDSYYNADANPTEAELIIAKNRDGVRGISLHIGWEAECQRFTNQADPSARPTPAADTRHDDDDGVI